MSPHVNIHSDYLTIRNKSVRETHSSARAFHIDHLNKWPCTVRSVFKRKIEWQQNDTKMIVNRHSRNDKWNQWTRRKTKIERRKFCLFSCAYRQNTRSKKSNDREKNKMFIKSWKKVVFDANHRNDVEKRKWARRSDRRIHSRST